MTTIVTRTGKGSILTIAEMDANLNNLNNNKLETSTVGVSVQAYSANLDEFATVNPTVAGLALLDDADAAAQRTTLGLAIGTDVQAYDADIPTVAASQAEMEAGTETALRSMSPQRVAQAIAALTDASGFTQGTPVSPTGVSSVTITSIPATAKMVVINFTGLSSASNTPGDLRLQIGPVGGVETTGYVNSDLIATYQVLANKGTSNGNVMHGQVTLTLRDSNVWLIGSRGFTTSAGGGAAAGSPAAVDVVGYKSLAGSLERINIALSVGNFDAGTINIMYQ